MDKEEVDRKLTKLQAQLDRGIITMQEFRDAVHSIAAEVRKESE